MTQRGPKPMPTQFRLLMGGAEARGLPENEPVPPVKDMPEPPVFLNAYALEEWTRLAEDLYGMGVLTSIDQTMLSAYCMAYARWRQAEEDLTIMAETDPLTHGAIIRTKEGNAIQNPLVGVANVARRDMARLAAEFGLSPSSRTLIDSGKSGETDPVAKRYFGRRGGA